MEEFGAAAKAARKAIAGLAKSARVAWRWAEGEVEVFGIEAGTPRERDCLLIDEALEAGFAVSEVAGGRVPQLRVCNRLDRDVLIIDGDVVRGGLQDRVANATVLLPPGTEAILPVSCVEARRWSGPTSEFRTSPSPSPSLVRAGKARSSARLARKGLAPLPDQGEVWNSVAAYHVVLDARSNTAALEDAFARNQAEVERFVRAFRAPEEPPANGIAVAVKGRVVSLDIFDSCGVLRRFARRAIRAHALDALAARRAGPPEKSAASGEVGVIRFFDALARVHARDVRVQPSPGRGRDVRLVAQKVVGGGLLDEDGGLVALAAFPGTGGPAGKGAADF